MRRDTVPPAEVMSAFGVAGTPLPLGGGRRTVWRVGDTVLKPLDTEPAAISWQAQLLGTLDADVRVAPPRAARDGRWVVADWTAWRYEPGAREPQAWRRIAAAGRALHRAFADVPAPPWLAARRDVWARADQTAWADDPRHLAPDAPMLADLLQRRRPVDPVRHRAQVVHADLTGNVLFADDGAPVVLDLSPTWRPVAFASAVVAIDAVLWEGADPTVMDAIGADEPDTDAAQFAQFLLRALLFRLLAAHFSRPAAPAAGLVAEFGPTSEAVLRRL